MKSILSFLAVVPFFSFAQYNSTQTLNYLIWGPDFIISNSMPYDYYNSKDERDQRIRENHVNSVKTVTVKKNGKKKVRSERIYNSNGLPIKEVNSFATSEYTYNGELLTDVVRTTKKQVTKTHADYDDEGRIVHITKHVNGKLGSEYKYVYYQGHQTSLVEQINYGRKTKVYKYVTEYDAVLKKPTRSQYFINGELQRNWTYSCDEKGEVSSKKVPEVSSCSYNARNNDGSYIEYTRTISNGKVFLDENTFTKDSVLIDSKRYYNEKILVFHHHKEGNTTVNESFNNRGKRTHKYTTTTDNNGNRIAWNGYTKKDKVKYGYNCIFSEQNLVQKVQYLSDKHFYSFEYNFF